MTRVRRCQGWAAFITHDIYETRVVIKQCERPAEDGTHCEEHKDQIPEEWMEQS